jgi:tetratricopeptide (TPR) repeat protein
MRAGKSANGGWIPRGAAAISAALAAALVTALAAALTAAIAVGAGAAESGGSGGGSGGRERYASCMALAATEPAAAAARAESWQAEGGGFPARHCAAASLEAGERFAEAAAMLVALAADMEMAAADGVSGLAPGLRIDILAQAGAAWLNAGDPEQARAAFGKALAGRPGDTALRLQRGLARALLGHYFDAVDDFNAALDADPENIDALVLRATAYRRLGSIELAFADLEQALTLLPEHPDALLEHGIVQHLRDDDESARDDWRRLIRAAPDSAAAQVARENLENLENTTD